MKFHLTFLTFIFAFNLQAQTNTLTIQDLRDNEAEMRSLLKNTKAGNVPGDLASAIFFFRKRTLINLDAFRSLIIGIHRQSNFEINKLIDQRNKVKRGSDAYKRISATIRNKKKGLVERFEPTYKMAYKRLLNVGVNLKSENSEIGGLSYPYLAEKKFLSGGYLKNFRVLKYSYMSSPDNYFGRANAITGKKNLLNSAEKRASLNLVGINKCQSESCLDEMTPLIKNYLLKVEELFKKSLIVNEKVNLIFNISHPESAKNHFFKIKDLINNYSSIKAETDWRWNQ